MKRDNAVRRLTVAAMLLMPTIAWAQLQTDDTRASRSAAPGAELEFGLLPLEHYRSLIIRDSYEAEFRRLVTAEMFAEAEAVGEKMLTIDRDVLRDDPTRLMESLELVAGVLAQRQDFGHALTLREEKHRLLAERPETSPQERLEHLQIVETARSTAQWTTEQRLVFGQLNSLFEQVLAIRIQGDWQRADAKFEEAMVQLRTLEGTESFQEGAFQFLFGMGLATTDHISLALNRLQRAESIYARLVKVDATLLRQIRIELANVLRRATEQHLNAAAFDLAGAAAERHLQVQQKVHSADSDSVIDAQKLIKYVATVAALDPEQRARWVQSVRDESQPLSLWREGKADEAERAAVAMLETCVDLLGNDSRQSLMARRTVAQLQSARGHYGPALANYQGILGQRISSYGATHGETTLAANDIVRTLESIANALVGDIDSVSIHSAELLLQSLLRETDWRRIGAERSIARIARLGKLTPAERQSLVDVQRSEQTASKLRQDRRYTEAVPLLQKLVESYEGLLGKDDLLRGNALLKLGDTELSLSRYAEAERSLLESLRVCESQLGTGHPSSTRIRLQLSTVYYRQQGRSSDAEQHLEQILAMLEQTTGPTTLEYGETMRFLGVVRSDRGRMVEGRELIVRALDILRQAVGQTHPEYDLALNNLVHIAIAQQDLKEAVARADELRHLRRETNGPQSLLYAEASLALGFTHLSRGEFDLAEVTLAEAKSILEGSSSEGTFQYAICLQHLVNLEIRRGNLESAGAWLKQFVENRRKYLSDNPRALADALEGCGANMFSRGQSHQTLSLLSPAESGLIEPLLNEAMKIRHEQFATDYSGLAVNLHNFGVLHRLRGDYRTAADYFEHALQAHQAAGQQQSMQATGTLNSLAVTYSQEGDFVRAESYRRRAIEGYRALGLTDHYSYIISMANLGGLYHTMGDFKRAEVPLRESIALARRSLGTQHVLASDAMLSLAKNCQATGDAVQAELLFQHALQLKRDTLGPLSLGYANGMVDLSTFYVRQGDALLGEQAATAAMKIYESVGAEEIVVAPVIVLHGELALMAGDLESGKAHLEKARAIYEKHFGKTHPTYAVTVARLAQVVDMGGDHQRAAAMFEESLDTLRGNMELAASAQSEMQQLAMAKLFRIQLDRYLSMVSRGNVSTDKAYHHVLNWKGAVFARQQNLRSARSSGNPQARRLVDELQDTTRRLSMLALQNPPTGEAAAWARQIVVLTDTKERLERELAQFTESGAASNESKRDISTASLIESLPAETALVDILEYSHSATTVGNGKASEDDRRLLAFVLQRELPVQVISLGAIGPIELAVDQWRADIAGGGGRLRGDRRLRLTTPSQTDELPQYTVRKLVWKPLEPHLQNASTILFSPDGALGRCPISALPGSKVDAYLLEERAIAIIPVARLLPALLAVDTEESSQTEEQLVLIGNIDFDASSQPKDDKPLASSVSRSAPRQGGAFAFQDLPGTKREVEAVKSIFTSERSLIPTVLQAASATESAARNIASNATYLHVATHGFFAPATIASADRASSSRGTTVTSSIENAGGFHPGLLSGLAFAGANRDAQANDLDVAGDDGIMTAIEVAELDLGRTELVVLSACETGLGRVAGGEGLLGLQRAFQLAGARSVAASLWQVDDDATRALMVEFYRNLWERKLGKLESLRKAQLAMLHRKLPDFPRVSDDAPSESSSQTLPPQFWAGFVLSGDWR